ncbi:MAG: hypothetical protein HZY76_11620 [Anaerolineae bacterium]|nr:MAG: hypothetical protein HZY76_11620 [Anaerolineae bacterium]
MKPNHSLIFLSLTMLASVFLACGPVNAVVNKAIGGNSDMRAVSQLWDDVPAMDGMGAAQQVEMPVWLKALTGPILDGMMKGLNDGQSAGHWDWTAFTLSGKTPDDVQAFYTPERMANTGWKQSESGCIPMADQGTLCTFTKEDQGKTTGLVIIAASDDQKKETSIFFRAEGLPHTWSRVSASSTETQSRAERLRAPLVQGKRIGHRNAERAERLRAPWSRVSASGTETQSRAERLPRPGPG